MTLQTLARIGILFAAMGALSSGAFAQGSEDMSSRAQSRGDPSQGDVGKKAQAAQVGAGTTNGSTTGFSGPKENSPSPGLTELPPLPSAKQCDSYKDMPAYQACLRVVLRD